MPKPRGGPRPRPRAGRGRLHRAFSSVSSRAAAAAGSAPAFTVALAVVLAWAATGPLFRFSDTWQLVINTGTTIVTFLMVFLLQHAQNRDTRAVQMKLDELIAAQEGASNRLINIEDLSEDELEVLHQRFRSLARDAARLGQGAATTVESEGEQDGRDDA